LKDRFFPGEVLKIEKLFKDQKQLQIDMAKKEIEEAK
jgi:hypothetical protein